MLANNRTNVGSSMRCAMSWNCPHIESSWKPRDLIPPTGTIRVRTASASRAIATTISGMEINNELPTPTTLSSHRPREAAVRTPNGTEMSQVRNIAVAVSKSVFFLEGVRRCHQRFGLRVIGTRNHLRCRTLLHNSPCRYDRNCIRQVRHKRHVMGDEEIGERMRCLKVKQQVGNLRLCREVEARKRFVQHQQFWLQRERPRDGQSLSLPPAEFHHRAVCRVRRKANFAHHFLGTAPAILLAAAPLNQQ